ncbi:chemotaxis protein [Rhodopseudomonas sp. B29]|uniref:chemotaxis protein n=1 Tax=Rhodopseudomonas sp. B29 TaxID=95607 RepID=UPI000344BF4C|nr:chemotaxis protein [Rhodopseudomonas sp. B29]
MTSSHHQLADAITSIEQVSSRIENTFAQVGGQLGEGHTIFQGLNESLSALSGELSSAQIEGASGALQDIARRLNDLAEALPAETALLDRLRTTVIESGGLLKQLAKQIGMIMIIARSAKIESASLESARGNFVAFTQEAFDLGKSVQVSIESCVRDQQMLAAAVETAWGRQAEFERCYRPQLGASTTDLRSAFVDLEQQRRSSVHIADLAGGSARKISDVVGRSIVLLQAGDSTRQRLEHVSEAVERAIDLTPSLVPGMTPAATLDRLIVKLEASQLKDAQHEFDSGIAEIVRSLSTIISEVSLLIERGRSLHGGKDGDSSFLVRVRATLAQASKLIAMCEDGGRSTDEALGVVESTLAKFRDAIANLADSIVDITLIGMNASLKAGHLGEKGRAFVVIANEMKLTADHMGGVASRLEPLLVGIGGAADELRATRSRSEQNELSHMEAEILQALREVEAGNERLGGLILRLVEEGGEFDRVMNGAMEQMTALGAGVSALPAVAESLESAAGDLGDAVVDPNDEAVLDQLYARYTMERERDVHRNVLRGFGIATNEPEPAAAECDFELF